MEDNTLSGEVIRWTTISETDIPRGELQKCDSISVDNYVGTVYLGVSPWHRENPPDQLVLVSVQLWRNAESPMCMSKKEDESGKLEVNYSQLAQLISQTLGRAPEMSLEASGGRLRLIEMTSFLRADITSAALKNNWDICALQIHVDLPKATHTGDSLRLELWHECLRWDSTLPPRSSLVYCWKGMRLNASIGWHAFEHQAKQRLILTLWLDTAEHDSRTDAASVILHSTQQVESLVVQFVETTAFKTLEGLGNELLVAVYQKIRTAFAPGLRPNLRLRIEKPLAVPLADAPVVELYRTSRMLENEMPRPGKKEGA